MKGKGLLLFFFLPFTGMLVIFFVFSSLNRSFVQRKTESLVREQLAATAEILKVNFSHLLADGYRPEEILGQYEGEENIYYLAILDDQKSVLAWSSRYEGYLPFSSRDAGRTAPWILSSPAGRIFNSLSPLHGKGGRAYYLYLGYSLGSLEEMTARSNRDSLLMFSLLVAVGVILFLGIFELQKRYLVKSEEADEAQREKGRFREISAFTSGVAHEIKNPLNSLSLLFELLRENASPGIQENVALGKAEVRKIARIIDRFSDSLKPLRLNRERTALREIMTAARDALTQESPRPDLGWRYFEEHPVILSADKNLLVQCFLNLFRNAHEAMERGTLSVEAKTRRKSVVIRVSDTGRGIPPDRLTQVFDPFFTTKETGMGIGLYLARKIVEAHGGSIDADSQPGKGTTFTILLPGGRHE